MKIKKITGFALALAMVISGGSVSFAETVDNALVSLSAATAETGFEFDAATGTITKYIGTDTEVVIPSTIDGIAVTGIGESAFEGSAITSIEIPDGVTDIGSYAFTSCVCLKSVNMPDSLTSIGDDAFVFCTGLTRVKIPKSITTMGTSVFFDCSSLKTVYCYKGSAADNARLYDVAAELVYIGDVNNDKSVDNIDAAIILEYAGGLINADSFDKAAADADENGTVNILDAVSILSSIK